MTHDREYICTCSLWDGIELNPSQELVRCKECKWNKSDKWVDCHITEMFGRTTDNYCSLAERKEE